MPEQVPSRFVSPCSQQSEAQGQIEKVESSVGSANLLYVEVASLDFVHVIKMLQKNYYKQLPPVQNLQ